MNLMINIIFMVLLTSLTGAFLHIIWTIGSQFFGQYSPKITYISLKIICLFYLLPIVYIFVWKNFHSSFYDIVEGENENIHRTLVAIPLVKTIFVVFFGILVLSFVILFICRAIKHLRWCFFTLAKRKETDSEILERMEKHRKRLSINRSVGLYRREGVNSPLCIGIFNKSILLPEKRYSLEQLDIIFSHELTHIKRHDIEMKYLAAFINLIHCFNPMAYSLASDIGVWSELCCDIDSCQSGTEVFTTKEYFDVILKEVGDNQKIDKFNFIALLFIRKIDLKRRIWYMDKCQSAKKWVKAAMVAGMVSSLAISSSVSYAAGTALLYGYDNLIKENLPYHGEIEDEESEVFTVSNIEEYWDITDVTDESGSMTRQQGKLYQWDIVPKGMTKVSRIYCTKGTTVSISCSLIGATDLYITAGVIDPDEVTGHFVKRKNAVAHDFTIEEDGYYSVAAVNNNSVDITVGFTYYLS